MTAKDFLGKTVHTGDAVRFWREVDEAKAKGREAKTYRIKSVSEAKDYWGFHDVSLEGLLDTYTLRALVKA